MIIACPACNTRYAVPDSAIGIDGRTVRCAKCRHSWFQDGPRLETAPAPAPAIPAEPPPQAPPPVAESAAPEPAPPAEAAAEPEPETAQAPAAPEPEPEAEAQPTPPLPEQGIADQAAYDYHQGAEEDYDESQFDYEPPFRSRRNPAKMWMLAAILFAVISLGLVAAVGWYGLPSWVPFARPAFAEEQPGLKFEFPPNRQERRTLADKSTLYTMAGTITNISTQRRSVPSLLVYFRDSRQTVVHTEELVPPKRVLAPGETVEINEAFANVPRSARHRYIGWKPGS